MEFKHTLSLIFIYIIALSDEQSAAVLPDLSSYNPLADQGFKVTDGWKHYTTSRTTVVGSAADLTKGETCERVIAFSAHGTVFDYHRTICDGLDPRIGLLEAFGALWYQKDLLARQESEDTYTILINKREKTCLKKTYTVKHGSPDVTGKPEATIHTNDDNYCNLLAHSAEPMMKYLSSNPQFGKYTSMTDWSFINVWEPLGAMIRFYHIERVKLYRFVVFTSYGRVVEKLKVTGGPMQGLVFTDKALYYGNVAMVKPQGTDMNTFTTLYNPNNGVCTKRTTTFSVSDGRVSKTRTKPVDIPESDPECQALINRKVSHTTVPESQLVNLRIKLADGAIDVKPFENGVNLEGRERMPSWDDINMDQDIGAVYFIYVIPGQGEPACQVIVLAKGVPLAGTTKGTFPEKVVLKEDAIYFDTDIMAKKGADENSFVVITRVDGDSCSKKTFVLRNEGGKMVKEEKSESKTKDDQECKDFIAGVKLKNSQAANYGAVVDHAWINTSVEEEIKSDAADPDNKGL